MWQKFVHELKRMWPLLAVIAVTAVIYRGDMAQLAVGAYGLSILALMVLVAHRIRKALFPSFDLSAHADKAREHPFSAAACWIAMVVFMALIIVLGFVWVTQAEEIPPRAKPHLPTLAATFDSHWPEAPLRCIVAGQIEQESGWRTEATLKTKRELGRGLAQLTIAYRADGTERFNAYREAVTTHKALVGWNWQAEPYHVGYALAYVVLRDRLEWTAMSRLMADEIESWRAALVCYNAGRGRILKRRAYAVANNLPADRWEGGLEHAHGPGEDTILYGKPLWAAVNHYPSAVFRRAAKYEEILP